MDSSHSHYVHPIQTEQVLPAGLTLPGDVQMPYRGEITNWTHQFGMVWGDHRDARYPNGEVAGTIRTSAVVRIFEHAGRQWVETRNSLYLLGASFEENLQEAMPGAKVLDDPVS